MIFAELLAELLLLFEDLKFWKKKKARRKFEKENGLPKRRMIYPSDKVEIIVILLIILIGTFYYHVYYKNFKQENTEIKMSKIELLLENEKKFFNKFPNKLSVIIRNNPFNKDITKDDWDNDFLYETSNNGLNYILISKGKDATLNTEDDIKIIK